MKRLFMRAYWGINDNSHRILHRKKRVRQNITSIVQNKFNEPFVTYVFGEENYKELKDLGCDCVLIHKEPFKYDLLKCQYRHKLEALRWAFEEEGVDELVHLDWDCIPQKKLPSNFWDVMGKREAFQANLVMYHRRKATWRDGDQRKIPNGGFVYIRDKSYPSKLIEIWETMRGPSAEPPMAKFTDEMTDGWQGIEKYWELFEPDFCNTHKMSPFSDDKLQSKDVCFIHYQG